MTLKKYIELLTKLVEENPNAENYEVVYSADDEGNRFEIVRFAPIIGKYEDGDFSDYSTLGGNAVCIN